MAKKKITSIYSIIAAIAVVALVLTASQLGILPDGVPSWSSVFHITHRGTLDEGAAEVHFVDCGQGDCEVIITKNAVTVIDAGPADHAESTCRYIKNLGVTRIDNIVFTHAHEDHIGGGALIIKSFDIGAIYMPKPKSGTEPATRVYRDLLSSIKDAGLKITAARAGVSFTSGEFVMNIISPARDYDEPNNQSAVVHAVYDDISFLFTGDAEKEPMTDMLKEYYHTLKSTVLKVGHHGSRTSMSKKWLKAVDPEVAVISCETGNDYGHPHKETLKMFEKYSSAELYRTDVSGSIVVSTDGKKIDVTTEKGADK